MENVTFEYQCVGLIFCEELYIICILLTTCNLTLWFNNEDLGEIFEVS